MNKPLKTWLFWVCILAALLGPVVVGAINHIVDSQFLSEGLAAIAVLPTAVPQTVCIPELDQAAYEQLDALTLSQENDLTISLIDLRKGIRPQ